MSILSPEFPATDAKGNAVAYEYDANSNVTQVVRTDANDLGGTQLFTTTFAYDNLDRLIERVEGAYTGGPNNTTLYAYDSRNNLVKATDPRGNYARHTVDALSRLTQTEHYAYGGSPVATVGQAWDARSRVTSRTDPNGNATGYSYDVLDRLTAVTYADGSGVDQAYDMFGNVTGLTDASGTVFTSAYDKLNRLTGRSIVPAPGVVNVGPEMFGYDGLSRLVSAQDSDSTVGFAYDSLDDVVSETLTIGVGGTPRTVTHEYDNRGNRTGVGYPGGRALTFGYNAVDQLASVAESGVGTIGAYSYAGGQVVRRDYLNGTRLALTYDGVEIGDVALDGEDHDLPGVLGLEVSSRRRNQSPYTASWFRSSHLGIVSRGNALAFVRDTFRSIFCAQGIHGLINTLCAPLCGVSKKLCPLTGGND